MESNPQVQVVYLKEESSSGGFFYWFSCLSLLFLGALIGVCIYIYFLAKRQLSSATTTSVETMGEGMAGLQMGVEIYRGLFCYHVPFLPRFDTNPFFLFFSFLFFSFLFFSFLFFSFLFFSFLFFSFFFLFFSFLFFSFLQAHTLLEWDFMQLSSYLLFISFHQLILSQISFPLSEVQKFIHPLFSFSSFSFLSFLLFPSSPPPSPHSGG